jgi:aquaporin Z
MKNPAKGIESRHPSAFFLAAIFAGKAYVGQLWLFWRAPVSGAVVAGLVGGALFRKPA